MANFGPLPAEIVSLVWVTLANFNGFRVLAALLYGILHLCLKNVPPLSRHNLYIHGSITTIFGKNVAANVGNHNMLYFRTSSN